MNNDRIKKLIYLSLLIPFLTFIICAINNFIPRFQLGNVIDAAHPASNPFFYIEVILPWVPLFVGLVFFIMVFINSEKLRSKILYSILYLIYLVLITHLSLILSYRYDYDKETWSSLNQKKYDEIEVLFLPKKAVFSKEPGNVTAKKIAEYLGYDSRNWIIKYDESIWDYDFNVSSVKKVSTGALGLKIIFKKPTGELNGILVGKRTGYTLAISKDF